jgi:hypothetical protein
LGENSNAFVENIRYFGGMLGNFLPKMFWGFLDSQCGLAALFPSFTILDIFKSDNGTFLHFFYTKCTAHFGESNKPSPPKAFLPRDYCTIFANRQLQYKLCQLPHALKGKVHS